MSERSGARWHLPLLVVLALPLFFFGLGSYSVVNGDEGIYHTIAATMVETGDWTYLDYHGQHRVYDTFMNAPTQYWARAVLISAFGDNLWTMRVLSAAFGLLTVVGVYALARRLEGTPGGPGPLLAGLVQLTTFQFVYLHGARTGELDAVVSFLFVALALGFLRAAVDGRSFVPHHLALALLLTVKLPLAVVPVAAELAWFACTPSARTHFRRYVASGFAVVPLGLVWHAAQALSLGEDFREVMAKMSGEAGGSVGAGEYTGTPIQNLWWYARKSFHGVHPWSVAVLAAVPAIALSPRAPRERAGWRAVLFLALGLWLFFLFVSKRFPWYVTPSYPLVAAAVGTWLARACSGSVARLVPVALVLVAAALIVPLDADPFAVRAARYPTELRVLDLGLAGFAALAAAGLGVVAALSGPRDARPARAGAALVLGLFVLAGARVLPPLAGVEHRSELAALAERLEARRAAGEPIRYPVRLPETEGWLRVQYHFGRRFVAVRTGASIDLVGERPTPPPERR